MMGLTQKEREALRPPEKMTVSSWADKYRVLDSRTSALPGRWRTANTPYLQGIMDAFNNPEVETITICTGTQCGKSETILNILGFTIHQQPGPVLFVFPSEVLAEKISKERLRPYIEGCSVLSERWNERGSETLLLQFQGANVALVGANVPASLASRPIRYLFMDELDKFPAFLALEADPISLARERTKTFRARKVVQASTPTVETGQIWREMLSADSVFRFFVPCPHCGTFQELEFHQIKWPAEITEEHRKALGDPQRIARVSSSVKEAAWYECLCCHGVIDDQDKIRALRLGRWTKMSIPGGGKKWELSHDEARGSHVAFHLNSLYSPWLTFGEIASEFLVAKDFPERFRNFVNSWLAEPWRDVSASLRASHVLDLKSSHTMGTVPSGVVFITGAVDVQQDHFWWSVYGHGVGQRCWLIDCGRAETWDEIEEILVDRRYPHEDGGYLQVQLGMIDAGYRTDEVYQFCTRHQGMLLPTKGSSKSLHGRFYSVSSLDREGHVGLKLYLLDTDYWKDFIAGRLQRKKDEPGSWMVPADVPEFYGIHMVAERKISQIDRKTGRCTSQWVPSYSHAPNHLWDCAVMNACAAEILGVRYLTEDRDSEEERPPRREGKREPWIKRR